MFVSLPGSCERKLSLLRFMSRAVNIYGDVHYDQLSNISVIVPGTVMINEPPRGKTNNVVFEQV